MEHVKNILSELNLSHLYETFEAEELTVEAIPELSNDELKELGVRALGARKMLQKKCKEHMEGTPISEGWTKEQATADVTREREGTHENTMYKPTTGGEQLDAQRLSLNTKNKSSVCAPETGYKAEEELAVLPATVSKGTPHKKEKNYGLEELRIVLIGKTGNGKSATGNTLLGREGFESQMHLSSVTVKCSVDTAIRSGKKLVIVDTPGLFDVKLSNEEIKKEIVRCIGISCPGPHAFIMVVGLNRFTEEEEQTVLYLAKTFGEKMYEYLIFVFTHKDELEKKGTSIERFLEYAPDNLKNLIKKCNNRFIAINNKLWNERTNSDVQEIIDLITQPKQQPYFTHDIFQHAEDEMRKLEEELKQKLELESKLEIEELKKQMREEVSDEKKRELKKLVDEVELRKEELKQQVRDEARVEALKNEGIVSRFTNAIGSFFSDPFSFFKQ